MGLPGGLLLLPLLLLPSPGGAATGPCPPHASCGDCVRSHPRCAWCQDPDFPRGGRPPSPRCAPREALQGAGCPLAAIVDPRGSVRVLRDEEPPRGQGPGGTPQLRPQRVRVVLRPGEEQSFPVRFRRPKGHPVDLYYLMDLSYSMRDDLEHVRRLGSDLLAALRNVTPSVHIGFGSFVDKPVLPYVSTAPPQLRSPCPTPGEPCEPAAAFRHLLPLTGDAGAFAERVGRLRISANLDTPESGLDAIVQAALCQEHVGWRPATRLLLFASDDTFHSAGDGKLGGIVLPSDSRCHLDASGVYAESHLYDYPSLAQLAQVLSATNIQPIFAVTRPFVPIYQELSRLLPRAFVGELRPDSSNVVQLVATAYDNLSSTVELQHPPLPAGITLSYECRGTPRSSGGGCVGVRENQEVTFRVRVQATRCLPGRQGVTLGVLGFTPELRLELETLCSCPCGSPQPHSPLCHGGTLLCGICSCPTNHRGRRCECEGGTEPGGCRPPNSTDPTCSSGGGCEKHRGLPCGGPQRGHCVCGRCQCQEGFWGPACGCPRGRGGCDCGTCRCPPNSGGPECPQCPPCRTPCQRLRDCADCGALGQGPLRGNCSLACPRVTPRLLPAAPLDPRGWCREVTPDGRLLLFLIEGAAEEEGGRAVTLSVWEEKGAGRPLVGLIAGLVAVGLVVMGLVALGLIRLGLELRDRREFQRSQQDWLQGWGEQVTPPPHLPQ